VRGSLSSRIDEELYVLRESVWIEDDCPWNRGGGGWVVVRWGLGWGVASPLKPIDKAKRRHEVGEVEVVQQVDNVRMGDKGPMDKERR
jgi:hypothetical protein